MSNKLALNLIAEVMGWPEESGEATREYAWLRLMSDIKYDGYSDFRAGARFLEALATWLKQFLPDDRKVAYAFIRRRLVYISPPEMQRLIEAFVPEFLTPQIRRRAAEAVGVKPYAIWGSVAGKREFDRQLRRTLIVGLSDGSRIDVLRRANSKLLTTEQVVPMMDIGQDKWEDLAEKLGEAGGGKFERVCLIDDFTASGTTFIRRIDGKWKGKLKKFNKLVKDASESMKDSFPLAENYELHIHHYVSSAKARQTLDAMVAEADGAWDEKTYGTVVITEGMRLPEALPLQPGSDDAMLGLCDRYYDHALFERLRKHCEEAKQTDMKLGYANCALPVILDHNAPNNAISLLWAETDGSQGAPMRPLFLRRDRHG